MSLLDYVVKKNMYTEATTMNRQKSIP